jgi:aspartate/methionine/tyrosine aminotransferase
MRLPLTHDTTIEPLIQKINSKTCFLSDWNKENDFLNFCPEIIEKAVNHDLPICTSNYLFIDEMYDLKKWFNSEVLQNTTVNLSKFNFSIASNGTSSAYLLFNILSKKRNLRVLLITPIYYTYIKVLNDLKVDVYYMEILKEGKININFKELRKNIVNHEINLIIINDPLLGSGIKITSDIYIDLVNICKKYNILLFVDFMYGGMDWNSKNFDVINDFLLNLFDIYSEIIIIESITKRLFINGIKNCLVYSSNDIINLFENISVYTIGSLVYSQITLFKQLYDRKNRSIVLNAIKKNITFAMSNFELIKTLLIDTNCIISACESGYFCLIGIPYNKIVYKDNMDIANNLMDNINILTIPHDRYLFKSHSHYYFRVNLSIEQSKLIPAIKKIRTFYNL